MKPPAARDFFDRDLADRDFADGDFADRAEAGPGSDALGSEDLDDSDSDMDSDVDSGLGPGDASSDVDRDAGAAVATGGPALTERERRILAFERQWWKHAGSKEQAIRDAFDLSATRYYQLLNGLLDNPAALAAEPVVVARLRRLRSTRARSRRR